MGSLPRPAPEASGIRSLSLPFLTPVVPARSRRFQVPWCGRSAAGNRPLPPTASLTQSRSFAPTPSDLLDLTEFQLDRRCAAEDRHSDLHARAPFVDFLDPAGE